MADEEKFDDYHKKMKEIEEVVDFGDSDGVSESDVSENGTLENEVFENEPVEDVTSEPGVNGDITKTSDTDQFVTTTYSDNERPNKQSGKMIKIVAIVCAALLIIGTASFFGYRAWEKDSMSYIMTFDGKRVGVETYKFFLMIQQSEVGASESAIDQIKESLVIRKAAADKGITLPEEERAKIAETAQGLKESIVNYGYTLPDVTDDELIDIMAITYYAESLIDVFNAEEFDQVAFDAALEEYKSLPQNCMNVDMYYLIATTPEDAEAARTALSEGADIEEVLMEYSVVYEQSGLESLTLRDLTLEQYQYDEIIALDEWKPTSVYDMGGSYVVFVPYSKTAQTDEEIADYYKELYNYQNGNINFQEKVDTWLSEGEFTLNQKAIDSIDYNEVTKMTPADSGTPADGGTPTDAGAPADDGATVEGETEGQ